jgi:hypothetical protein
MSPRNSTNAALVCRGRQSDRAPRPASCRAPPTARACHAGSIQSRAARHAGRQRQHRIQTVECLDRRFLIDREHRGVVRRIDVQADHVGRFLFEVGIVRRHVALEPMRLQARALPRFADEIVVNLQQAPKLAGTPMGAAVRRRLPGLLQHASFHRRGQDCGRRPAISRAEPLQPAGEKPPSPPVDVVAVARDRRFDRRVRFAVSQHQDHPSAARILRSDFEAAHTSLKFSAFVACQCQRHMARQRTSTSSVSTVH